MLCTRTLGYIDHGSSELSEIAGSVKDRTADGVNVPDPFFQVNDPVAHFEISFVADGPLEPSPARRLIVLVFMQGAELCSNFVNSADRNCGTIQMQVSGWRGSLVETHT
jgi:hypothetical protein